MKSSLLWLNVRRTGSNRRWRRVSGKSIFCQLTGDALLNKVNRQLSTMSNPWVSLRTPLLLSAPLVCRFIPQLSYSTFVFFTANSVCLFYNWNNILFFFNLPLCVMSCLIRQVSQAFGRVRWKIRVYMMGWEGVKKKCKQVVCEGFEGGGGRGRRSQSGLNTSLTEDTSNYNRNCIDF